MPRARSIAIRIGVVMFAAVWAAALALHPHKLAAAPARSDTELPAPEPSRAPAPLPPAPPWPAVASGTAAPPPTARRDGAGPRCTIAVITENVGTSDTYLSRLTFPAPAAPAAGQEPICPPGAAQAATGRALDACKQRAAHPQDCVYADTDRLFDITTDVMDSSPLDSQCFSYKSKFVAIACRPGAQQDNCNVACGATAAAATDAATTRCRTNHDGECALLNAVPVQAP